MAQSSCARMINTRTAEPARGSALRKLFDPRILRPMEPTAYQAQQVNVVAYLFEHGGTRSVPPGFDGQVVLRRALNNGAEEAVALGDKETRTVNGVTFPVWTFNDVDVAAARDARNKYYFRLEVWGTTAYSNIWAHASDARTYVPQPDVPNGVAP